jgi:hypothetical protein
MARHRSSSDAFEVNCMKTDAFDRCSRRVVLAVAAGVLLSPISRVVTASDDASAVANPTGTKAEQLDCSKHGGKVKTFQCATRPLDTVPAGKWLKGLLAVAILVGVGYQTIRHLSGFVGGGRPDESKRDGD